MKKIIFINPKIWILFFAFLFIATLVPTFYISIIFDIKIGIIFFVVSYFSIFFLKILLGFYKIDREMSKEIILIGRKKKEYFLEEGKIYIFFFTRFKKIFLIPKENKIFGEKEIKTEKDGKVLVSFNVSFVIENIEIFYKFYKFKKFLSFDEFQDYLGNYFLSYFDCFFQKFNTDIFVLRNFVILKQNGKFEELIDPELISSISELENITGINLFRINFEVDEKK